MDNQYKSKQKSKQHHYQQQQTATGKQKALDIRKLASAHQCKGRSISMSTSSVPHHTASSGAASVVSSVSTASTAATTTSLISSTSSPAAPATLVNSTIIADTTTTATSVTLHKQLPPPLETKTENKDIPSGEVPFTPSTTDNLTTTTTTTHFRLYPKPPVIPGTDGHGATTAELGRLPPVDGTIDDWLYYHQERLLALGRARRNMGLAAYTAARLREWEDWHVECVGFFVQEKMAEMTGTLDLDLGIGGRRGTMTGGDATKQ